MLSQELGAHRTKDLLVCEGRCADGEAPLNSSGKALSTSNVGEKNQAGPTISSSPTSSCHSSFSQDAEAKSQKSTASDSAKGWGKTSKHGVRTGPAGAPDRSRSPARVFSRKASKLGIDFE